MTQTTTSNPTNLDRLDRTTMNLDKYKATVTADTKPTKATAATKTKKQEGKTMTQTTAKATTTKKATATPNAATVDNMIKLPTAPAVDLENLREEATKAAHVYSGMLASDSVAAIEKARTDAQACVDAYNQAYIDDLFARLLDSDTPVLDAVTAGYWRKMKLNTKRNDKTQCVEIDYTSTVIDLSALDKAAKERHIMQRANWKHFAEKLTYWYAMRATKDIDGDKGVTQLKKRYDISEFARDDRLFWGSGKRPGDVTSNTQLLNITQTALDAILMTEGKKDGENGLRVTSHDVCYVLYTCFKKGKTTASVAMPKPGTIITALTEIAYRVANKLRYTAEYKEIEKKEADA